MRIISKFHDYYDTAIGYGIDPNYVYIRDTVVHDKQSQDTMYKLVADEFFEFIQTLPSKTIFSFNSSVFMKNSGAILFCGKMYPFIEVSNRFETNTAICFTIEDVSKFVTDYASDDEKKAFFSKNKKFASFWNFGGLLRYRFNEKSLAKFFEDNHGKESIHITEVHQITKIPVISLTYDQVTYNPVLKDYEFYKVVDPFTAFQELSMYIGGVLGGNSPEMVNISNDDKIHKHGFDEWSFKKHKDDNK